MCSDTYLRYLKYVVAMGSACRTIMSGRCPDTARNLMKGVRQPPIAKLVAALDGVYTTSREREWRRWMVTVIVAEGDEARRGAMRLALAQEGYAVVEVETGLAALTEMAAGAGPLVAVVGVRMPDLDGAEVARFAQRTLCADRHLAVVLMASDAQAGSARARRAADADDRSIHRLSRPFTPGKLVRTVRAAEWAMFARQPERMEAISYG